MGEISPVPGKSVDPKRFEVFKSDLNLLLKHITQDEMGKEMGIIRSNVNKYIKGNLPITKGFLTKFYRAWSYRINEEKKNSNSINEDTSYPQSPNRQEPTMRDIMTILERIEKKIDGQTQ